MILMVFSCINNSVIPFDDSVSPACLALECSHVLQNSPFCLNKFHEHSIVAKIWGQHNVKWHGMKTSSSDVILLVPGLTSTALNWWKF